MDGGGQGWSQPIAFEWPQQVIHAMVQWQRLCWPTHSQTMDAIPNAARAKQNASLLGIPEQIRLGPEAVILCSSDHPSVFACCMSAALMNACSSTSKRHMCAS